MNRKRSATERLVAARPPVAGRLDELARAEERAQLLERILSADTTAVDPAHPASKRRTVPLRPAVAILAAAAVAALVATTLVVRPWPGQSPSVTGPIASHSAIVLLSNVASAVAKVNAVAVITSTNDGVVSTFWTLTQGGHATRMRYSVDGNPSYDQTISTVNGRRIITNVDFAARAWWRVVAYPVPGSPCVSAVGSGKAPRARATTKASGSSDSSRSSCQVFGPTPGLIVQSIRTGVFSITGHPVVNGRPTIQVTAHYAGLSGTYQLFVDPTSHLPLMSINSVNSAPFTTTYRYLPETKDNMALLQVPIPPGFRHVDQPIRCDLSQLGPHGVPEGCP